MAHDSPPSTAESEAMLGYGSHFQIESADSPSTFSDIGEVFNISPPSFESDQIEVTHMNSPNRRREYIDGLVSPGSCSFEMNYIPGSEGDEILLAILDAPFAERRKTCRIIYPNGVIDQFSANLQTYEPTVPTDDRMTANVTFQVTGTITRGTVDSPPDEA